MARGAKPLFQRDRLLQDLSTTGVEVVGSVALDSVKTPFGNGDANLATSRGIPSSTAGFPLIAPWWGNWSCATGAVSYVVAGVVYEPLGSGAKFVILTTPCFSPEQRILGEFGEVGANAPGRGCTASPSRRSGRCRRIRGRSGTAGSAADQVDRRTAGGGRDALASAKCV